jgi:hypothetical protein
VQVVVALELEPVGQLERGADVAGLEREEAAERLLHGHEWPVGGERLAVLDAHGRRQLGRLHLGARGDARRPVDLAVAGVDRLLLLLGKRGPGLRIARGGSVALVNQHEVLHLVPPCGEWSRKRRTSNGSEDTPC